MTQSDLLMAEIERCIDGDLDRGERLALFEHLGATPEAAGMMAEAVALQRQMSQLADAYDRIEPSAAFMAAPLVQPAREAPRPPRLQSLARGLGAWVRHPVAASGWGGFAGAAIAAAVFVYILTPARDIELIEQMAAQQVRLHVLDVPFEVVADTHDWTHGIRVAPGETARIEVIQGHEDAYHLRVVGGGEVNVSLVHSRPKAADESRRLKGGTVHYTSLMAPKTGDALLVTNHGSVPLEVSVAAKNQDAVTVRPHKPAPAKREHHASVVTGSGNR